MKHHESAGAFAGLDHGAAFRQGLRDGVPIGLGYFAVSFSLGIAARSAGFTAFQALLMSLFNNASAGEFAAFTLVGAGAAVVPQSRAQTPDAAGEAIEALMALGYQSSEAARAVSSLSPLPDTADEIIRQALKSML